jgi:hypothetical protein
MSTSEIGRKSSSNPFASLTPLHLVGLLLAAVTGAIHLWLGIEEPSVALFIAGVGFVVGIVAVATNIRRRTVVKLGIPFTATQFVYYLGTHFDHLTQVGILDKVVQFGLIVVLVVLARRS